MFAQSVSRVSSNTAEHINEQIHHETEESIRRHVAAGPAAIERRLSELDGEWDIERTLESNASTLSLVGCVLGATVNRKWFILPCVVQTFLLQHALQGWCPPLPVLRRLGLRTTEEINRERYALKALRGDFEGLKGSGQAASVGKALEAVQ